MDESTMRVEIAIRAGMIAKAALELLGMDPRLVHLQLVEIVKQVRELDAKLKTAELSKPPAVRG